ncbi:MAG: pyridoxal phosphate-dependent aminotransferase [Candidatus Kapabacteria bacterium]|jgi:cystathionine beta-lyase|nr:pyridoxal phosphate-dependent aminotransferase [Candidatus Kapabacteria bacterium]
MKYNFDEIINRKGTDSIKWDAGKFLKKKGFTNRFDEDTLSLFLADMDFACPPPLLDSLHKRLDQKILGYSTHSVNEEYFAALRNWFAKRYDWKIADEEVVYCPGTVLALNVAVMTYTKPGDGIIIQRPVYPPFTGAVESHKREVINNELINTDGYYTIDFDDLESKAKDPNTTMMIFCSPHNPVGRVWTAEEIIRVADICSANNVLLLADEIHGDLVLGDNIFYPTATVSDIDNLVVCTAINKTFNVAGLHCSNIIIKNKDLRERYTAELGMAHPSPFAISAMIAAYTECDEWLEQLNEYLDANFEFLKNFIAEKMPKVKFVKPEGTYIGWLDFSEYGLSANEIHDRIYNKANVVFQDGKMFSSESTQFQRICVPTPLSILKEAMERIAKEF